MRNELKGLSNRKVDNTALTEGRQEEGGGHLSSVSQLLHHLCSAISPQFTITPVSLYKVSCLTLFFCFL